MKQFLEVTVTTRNRISQQKVVYKVSIAKDAILYYKRYFLRKIYTVGIRSEMEKEIFSFLKPDDEIESVLATSAEIKRLQESDPE